MSRPAISDYGIIGDGRSIALVSREGSIDWLCWPAFDSPAIFAALLDERAGHFCVGAAGPARLGRRYLGATNLLETSFTTADGAARLIDLMPALSEEDKRQAPLPSQQILRRVECDRGEIEIDLSLRVCPDFATRRPRTRVEGSNQLSFSWRSRLVRLRSEAPIHPTGDGAQARVRLRAGDVVHFELSYTQEAPELLAPLDRLPRWLIARSLAWWEAWAARCTYVGPYRDAVLRSALALKLLQYAPSGAIIAAPTTSLPESPGGGLNWDYRYCWLRDSSLTARTLYGLGYTDEGNAFVSWLLHATRLTRPRLLVLYDRYGRPPPAERTLDHLEGYGGARPVRVGNAARDQLQLDIYGEVIDAATRFRRAGGDIARDTARFLRDLGDFICVRALDPDEGIWEPRSGRRSHTHSLMLSWAALDRLLEMRQPARLGADRVAAYAAMRARLRALIEARAYNRRLEAYTGTLDGEDLDASLLLMPYHRFAAGSSKRVRSTLKRILADLGAGPGLLYRRPESRGTEGAFTLCSFWAVECMARGATPLNEACRLFERVLGYQNDLGLYGEEIDPQSGDALGNFPQGFSHLGLIGAAMAIEARARAVREVRARLLEAQP